MKKVCNGCGEEKDLVNFARDKTKPDGKNPICKYCVSVRLAEKYGVPRERVRKINYSTQNAYWNRPEVKARRREYQRELRKRMTAEQLENRRVKTREWRERSPRTAISANLFNALRRRPTANPVTLDELMEMWHCQGGRCAISGVEMTWRRGKVLGTSISLDRVDQCGGYTKGNTRLICQAVNLFRGNGTDEEMLVMARAIIAKADVPSADCLLSLAA